MITIEKTCITGWDVAIRGMRNSFDSWDKSDSIFQYNYVENQNTNNDLKENYKNCNECSTLKSPCAAVQSTSDSNNGGYALNGPIIGPNDITLMQKLAHSSDSHAKFMRYITVTMDVTAPRYWWAEADTYKIGTVRNSCSTMHTITRREFTRDNFSCDKMTDKALNTLDDLIKTLNELRSEYLTLTNSEKSSESAINDSAINDTGAKESSAAEKKATIWYSIIQLLPASFMQKATLLMNYQVLKHIYNDRKVHKLAEWREFCRWIKALPYADVLIVDN